MAYFEIQDSFDIGNSPIAAEQISEKLQSSLSNHFRSPTIQLVPNGFSMDGYLKGSWEFARTKATLEFSIVGDQVHIRVHGKVSFGIFPWVYCAVLSLIGIGFFVFFMLLVMYLTSKDKPRQYIEDAIKAVKFELLHGDNASARIGIHNQYTSAGNAPISTLEALEKFSILRDKGILSEEEFNAKKSEILNL